jgi:hypothetical protein
MLELETQEKFGQARTCQGARFPHVLDNVSGVEQSLKGQ